VGADIRLAAFTPIASPCGHVEGSGPRLCVHAASCEGAESVVHDQVRLLHMGTEGSSNAVPQACSTT